MKNPQIFTKLVSPVRLLGQALSKTRKPGFSSVGKVEQRAHWPAFGCQGWRSCFLNSKPFVASVLDSSKEHKKAWAAELFEQKA